MTSLANFISDSWSNFYELNVSYYHSPEVNIEANIDDYSFDSREPEQAKLVADILDFHLEVNGAKIGDFLKKSSIITPLDRYLLKQNQFELYSSCDDIAGIVLGHPLIPNFLIKQNFSITTSFAHPGSGKIFRFCSAARVPFWLCRFKDWFSQDRTKNIRVPNDVLNPLRVVTMKKARQYIKKQHLDRIEACKEYLFRLPDTATNAPIHKKYVVISKKVSILNSYDNIQKFIDLAKNNPNELAEILKQVCLVIKHTHLTDMHINNIRFAGDGSNKVYLFDGEPIGGLSDISEPDVKKLFKGTDFAFFPILGMRVLQESLKVAFSDYCFKNRDYYEVQNIFDKVIDPIVESITQDRIRYYTKIIISIICPAVPLFVIARGISNYVVNHFRTNNLIFFLAHDRLVNSI
ncbi:hypothetical protein [Candidatus Protochlamydia sp. R18]|uniref:hypothetical protein n=1 Tax=Candidatus Protochlamydia sp. R18 TaxID=1353977 RepID=UPI0005A61BA0|nr:hypothetical protein [Candidatus Protochlamydia sp. R18]